jgi:hypothetical protein
MAMDKVYCVISQRLRDKFDPLNQYIHLRAEAKNAFELRYEK